MKLHIEQTSNNSPVATNNATNHDLNEASEKDGKEGSNLSKQGMPKYKSTSNFVSTYRIEPFVGSC